MSDFIINLLLFFFQFEYLSKGGLLTVSRVIIFPLLCAYLLMQRRIRFPLTAPMIICLIFFVVQVFSSIGNAVYTYLFSAILQFLILLVFTDYLHKKKGFSQQNWWMFVTYDITSIICYFVDFSLSETSRFSGIYWDPNVMCFYLLISICAKLYLFPGVNNLLLKMFFIGCFVMDIFLIIQSLSRGALLALLVISLIILYRYSRFIFSLFVILLIPTISYLYITYSDAVWDNSMSSIELLMYRMFSVTGEELTSARDGTRLARYQVFFESLYHGDISILGNSTNEMTDGEYVHNGLLEFILVVGLPMGLVFIVMFITLVYKTLFKQLLYRKYDFCILLPISFLFSSFFYSYLGYKMFWFFMAILLYDYYNINRKNISI